MATQRAHNFKMSYEGGTQFQAEKNNMSDPYRLPATQAKSPGTNADLGKSNRHSVQIGHNSRQPEFQTMTMQQQDGGGGSAEQQAQQAADTKETKEGTARLKADLRSSHFALGSSKSVEQSSSAAQYRAPPYTALIGSSDTHQAGERLRRSNFALADGTKSHGVGETALQAQNRSLQRHWENGEITKSKPAAKPVTTVAFGQGCQYTSAAKEAFIKPERIGSLTDDKNKFKDKFTKGNILLEASGNQNDMQTVQMKEAQYRNFAAASSGDGQGPGGSHNAKAFAQQMRAANFNAGYHLPETNAYAAAKLEKGNAQSANTLGQVPKRVDFRQNAKAMLPPSNAQGVSAGNTISRGKGDFQTVNQSYVKWIQPKATAPPV